MLRRTWPVAVSLAFLLAAPAQAQAYSDASTIDSLSRPLTRPPAEVALPALPAQPVEALVTAANAHSASLGHAVDHGPAIRRSGIPQAYAGRVAHLLDAVLACRPATTDELRLRCAGGTGDAAAGIVRTGGPAFADLDLWPTLYVDGNGGDNRYVHDYVVLIDRGGNDLYDNNAGGNLIDHKRGPAGSVAPLKEPAIGCEQVQGNFPAPTASAHDCLAAPQVALVDYKVFGPTSDDTYGVLKSPRRADHNPPNGVARLVDGDCTNDPLVRRMVTQGSGFEGNGLLMDVDGNDRYLGKTAAQGSGHVGGVGVLRDLGRGNDSYHAIRNAQGFALVGVIGVLQEDGGNDRYTTYMPRPKDPAAAFQTRGSGGVVDDTGLCDNLPRMVQGTALLGGAGLLQEEDGADYYMGDPPDTQAFQPGITFAHSSQGYGCSGGIGILHDFGKDADTYTNGPAGRTNGASVDEVQTSCAPAAPGISAFSDDGR